MAGDAVDSGETYSKKLGFVYAYNLIVGAGALSMPQSFQGAGIVPGIILLAFIAFMAFVSVTYLIEAMSLANAHIRLGLVTDVGAKVSSESKDDAEPSSPIKKEDHRDNDVSPAESHEMRRMSYGSEDGSHSMELFEITERVELSKMAQMFFANWGLNLFYIIVILYLYGDLAIYATAVAVSIQRAACTSSSCFGTTDLSPAGTYYIFLTVFIALVGPICFFNFQKTKLLQMSTLAVRYIAFITMIVLGIVLIAQGADNNARAFGQIEKIPSLFGVSIYAYMCHHSLPSLVTPIKNKNGLFFMFMGDYVMAFGFYTLLCLTAVFAFAQLQSLYTTNFVDLNGAMHYIGICLSLLPVFTLASSFPLITITLRRNLIDIFRRFGFFNKYPNMTERTQVILFTLIALIPALAFAYGKIELRILVDATGAYPGICIMLVIPAFLVRLGRRKVYARHVGPRSHHTSFFRHAFWFWFIMVCSVCCAVLMTYNIVMRYA